METTIMGLYGDYRVYIGIMEKKMETTMGVRTASRPWAPTTADTAETYINCRMTRTFAGLPLRMLQLP